eukprot:TRINITY_DN226_c0_g1_i10.p1 TRINITY_DN226_c0_g1~~TRINITY_DN226_c0_g1_i10.p1  ORF type:complete len:277 (-),score=99.16 TRINITY_DN226_c0_g1_i10:181-1011(-)
MARERFETHALNDPMDEGDFQTFQQALQTTDVDAPNEYGQTALHIAAKKGLIKYVQCLINSGANLDAQDVNQDTPLHAATAAGKPYIVQSLLQAGANPFLLNKFDHFGEIKAYNSFIQRQSSFSDNFAHCVDLHREACSFYTKNGVYGMPSRKSRLNLNSTPFQSPAASPAASPVPKKNSPKNSYTITPKPAKTVSAVAPAAEEQSETAKLAQVSNLDQDMARMMLESLCLRVESIQQESFEKDEEIARLKEVIHNLNKQINQNIMDFARGAINSQ